MTSVVLITGVKGSGKDTAGLFFTKCGYVKYAFADELKTRVAQTFALPLGLFHNRDTKDAPIPSWMHLRSDHLTPRDLCISYGDYTRSIFPDIWAQHVKTNILTNNDTKVVITDCRYQNEIDVIKSIATQTTIIRIVRSGIVSDDDCDLQNIGYDIVFPNDGTIEELHAMIAKYVNY